MKPADAAQEVSFGAVVDAFEKADRDREQLLREVARALRLAEDEFTHGLTANMAFVRIQIEHALDVLRKAHVNVP